MLLLAGLVIAFRGGNDDKTVNASTPSTTTTTEPNNIVVSPSSTTTTVPGATTTTAKASLATTIPSTTTTTSKPIETAEFDCIKITPAEAAQYDNWQEYWTTDPGLNQPMELQLCLDDTTPKVGQVINIEVRARDKDQQVGTGECDIRVTWTPPPKKCRTTTVVENGQQPTPMPDTAKGVAATFTHVYTDAGDETIDVAVWSGKDDQKRNPYKSYASISRQITVHK